MPPLTRIRAREIPPSGCFGGRTGRSSLRLLFVATALREKKSRGSSCGLPKIVKTFEAEMPIRVGRARQIGAIYRKTARCPVAQLGTR